MTAKVYCRIAGVILLITVPLGLGNIGMPGVFSFNEPAEIGLHLVAGLLAAFAGFSGGSQGQLAGTYARIFSVVYVVLAAIGFMLANPVPGVIHLDLGCNFIHLALGLWGLWAGYFAERPDASQAAPAHA